MTIHFIIGHRNLQVSLKMEQLTRLIKDASNQFECHNFQTALSLYVRCIQKCEEQKLPKYVLHNLKSSEAALRAILGEQEVALAILNGVLSENKEHWLSLMRRSQIHKRQNNYKMARKDLEILALYAPDNLQVAALKLEIENLMKKGKVNESDSESDSEKLSVNEDEVLQFSNLRKIDRTSVSIMIPKGRQSRVTISGDSSFCYESEKSQISSRQSTRLTPHFIRQKFIEIEEELEQVTNQKNIEVPIVIIKAPPSRNKSILRNRQSKIYTEEQPNINLLSTEEGKRLIEKLQDIQGHIIGSEHGSTKNCSEKEVQFKKSLFNEDPQIKDVLTVKKKHNGRKSCLKRPSFNINTDQTPKGERRRSKFDSLTRSSIDGKFIKSDSKKKATDRQAQKQNIGSKKEQSGDESEQGSQFNIFGSRKIDINKELRENFGFESDQIMEIEKNSKPAKKRGQSILKKTSIIVKKDNKKQGASKKSSVFFRQFDNEFEKTEKKSKKSVMFRTC